MVSPSLVTASALVVMAWTSSHAFSACRPLRSTATAASTTNLFGYLDLESDDSDEYDDSHFDVEKARERLEALVNDESERESQQQQSVRPTIQPPSYAQSPLPPLDVVLPPLPPLTSIDRERRQVEIRLLSRLTEGDDSLSDLWTLWYGERGSAAAQKLVQAEEYTNQGPARWQEAETMLQELVQDHGVYWVEPINRLSTLYYMQGRLEEAETLCQVVLAVKPWHFGALSGIVMIYAAQTDSEKARLWAASRLPTFAPSGPNRRRIAWAEKAVQSAQESLACAEKRVRQLFGEADPTTYADTDHHLWEEDGWQ